MLGSGSAMRAGSRGRFRASASVLSPLLAALLAGACHSREQPVEVHVLAASADSHVLTAVTQPSPPASRPRVLSRTVAVGVASRHYVLVVPQHLDGSRAYPLVLYFHGDGGDGEGMQRNAPFEVASGDAALVAYPDGARQTWDLETTMDNHDVAFAEALVADVAKDFSIDRHQVFAYGYSSGGFFASVLACQRASLLRAVASNAGGAPYHQAESWPNEFPKCPGEAPVAAIALHGDADNGVTLDSGRFTAEYWAYIDGCNMAEMETTAYPECRAYRGCKPGKDVVFCKVPGLGHWVWDRAPEVSWGFFRGEVGAR
jgi:polyhydroxybutyrate depolymerase